MKEWKSLSYLHSNSEKKKEALYEKGVTDHTAGKVTITSNKPFLFTYFSSLIWRGVILRLELTQRNFPANGSEDLKHNMVLRPTQWPWWVILKFPILNSNFNQQWPNSDPDRYDNQTKCKWSIMNVVAHIPIADLFLLMFKFQTALTCILAKRMIITFNIFSRYVEHL